MKIIECKAYRELVSYIFWGAATTLVNYSVYFSCTKVFHIHYLAGNVIAWIISVIFAFMVNKIFVFKSKTWNLPNLFRQVLQFVSARIFSGGLETLLLLVLVSFMGYDDSIIKVLAGIIVIIVNYIFSKWIIFNEKPTKISS